MVQVFCLLYVTVYCSTFRSIYFVNYQLVLTGCVMCIWSNERFPQWRFNSVLLLFVTKSLKSQTFDVTWMSVKNVMKLEMNELNSMGRRLCIGLIRNCFQADSIPQQQSRTTVISTLLVLLLLRHQDPEHMTGMHRSL